MNQEAGWYLRVHPVFRILCFLILSLSLVVANGTQLVLLFLILLALYFSTGTESLGGLSGMLRRLRWFFLSILVIYGWWTPGPVLFGMDDTWWMPSAIGLQQGLHRVLVLVMIVSAVHWLLWVTSREQLVAAIYWLAAPLALIGISRERIAVRMALVLELVPTVQDVVREQLVQHIPSKHDIRGYAAALVEVVSAVVIRAEQSPMSEVEIDISDTPPYAQWLWPILLTSAIVCLGLF